jgi:hypothetical protein
MRNAVRKWPCARHESSFTDFSMMCGSTGFESTNDPDQI